MAVEIIEGTLGTATVKSRKRGYAIFAPLTIVTSDGQTRTFAKVATGEPVTSEVLKGGAGRFTIIDSDGAKGLVGVRRPDGTKVYGHFSNFAPVLFVVGILGMLGGVAKYGFGVTEFPLTPVVLGPLLFLAALWFNAQKSAGRKAFEADNA
jgi:hypothetical protein